MSRSSEIPLVITSDIAEAPLPEVVSVELICRLCTNQSDKLIGIYSEDGVSNDLAGKLNLYLPIKVAETDHLPLQCCWQCASTVLAWHDLVIISVEADRRLRSYQLVTDTQLEEITKSYETSEEVLPGSTEESMVEDATAKRTDTQFELTDGEEILIEGKSDDVTVNLGNKSPASTTSIHVHDLYIQGNEAGIEKHLNCDDVERNKHNVKQMAELSEEEEDRKKNDVLYKYECLNCPMLFFKEDDVMDHIKETHPDVEDLQDGVKVGEKEDDDLNVNESVKKGKLGRRKRNTKHQTKHPVPKIDQEEINKAKVVVDGRTFYMCKECGKTLHSVYTYGWHMRIHTGERPYECNLCGKTFRVSQGLMKHIKETHERIKNFACDICHRNFTTKRNVEEHRRIHTNERPYICATCGKSFKQRASLFVHNRSHSGEFPFSCSECPQKFRTKPILMLHATKHTGEKPFPCDVCGRHFRIKYELKRHKLIHSDDKPFKCQICGQTFKQKRYLRNHLKFNHDIWDVGELLAEYSNAS